MCQCYLQCSVHWWGIPLIVGKFVCPATDRKRFWICNFCWILDINIHVVWYVCVSVAPIISRWGLNYAELVTTETLSWLILVNEEWNKNDSKYWWVLLLLLGGGFVHIFIFTTKFGEEFPIWLICFNVFQMGGSTTNQIGTVPSPYSRSSYQDSAPHGP